MKGAVYDLPKITKKLEKYLTPKRLWHTIGVMHTAASLAMVHDVSLEQAQVAGLLHDCAKCIPHKKALELCKKNNLPVSAFEEKNPLLLHGKLGAWIAQEKYQVTDREILSAITWHTTGKEDMTALEKIIFIADYIEPARNQAPNLKMVRSLAFKDLNLCMYQILQDTLDYLKSDRESIDETTEQAYAYYKNIVQKENKA